MATTAGMRKQLELGAPGSVYGTADGEVGLFAYVQGGLASAVGRQARIRYTAPAALRVASQLAERVARLPQTPLAAHGVLVEAAMTLRTVADDLEEDHDG